MKYRLQIPHQKHDKFFIMNRTAHFHTNFASRTKPEISRILRPEINDEGKRLQKFLDTVTPTGITAHDIRSEIEGNLWMLSAEALLYFLPAFLHHSLVSYGSLSVFVSELVDALTYPVRTDVSESLDYLSEVSSTFSSSKELYEALKNQQLEWFDSGTPTLIFRERFKDLTYSEGATILDFLNALKENHGQDFPFGELENSIDRYWFKFKNHH